MARSKVKKYNLFNTLYPSFYSITNWQHVVSESEELSNSVPAVAVTRMAPVILF